MPIKKLFATSAIIALAGPAFADDIVIGVPSWSSANATANILKIVIEENLGLDVELQNGTNPIIFEAMDNNSMHMHPEVYLPNQQNLHDKYVVENGTVVMSENYVTSSQGMCVPTYVAEDLGVTSIDDLSDPEKAKHFDSDGDGTPEIWIGAPGWASTVIEKIRAKSYGYGEIYDLVEYEESVAYGNLATATNAKVPWIGFCYTPHYIFATQDLTRLEEPAHDPATWNIIQPTDDPDWLSKSQAATAWGGAQVHMHYAKSLEEDYPQVAALFANVSMTPEDQAEMGLALAVEGKEPADFAREWITANEDRVLDWLSN